MYIHFLLWRHIPFDAFSCLGQTDRSAQTTASCLKLHIFFQITQFSEGHNCT